MKAWIEYYDNPNQPALGDRSIVRIDGRNNLETQIADGHRFNGYRRPKYNGFRIIRGESLLRTRNATPYIRTDTD